MRKDLISNFLWRFMERIGAKSISMLVQIVLARLLLPDDYGIVALVTVFSTILEIFVNSGMSDALIQKYDADELDYSTVFFFNIGMCTLLYVLLFAAAPYISLFYHNPAMTPLIRVSGMSLLVSGLKNVQQAYVASHMLFRKFFFSTFGGTIFSAFVGIGLAYAGAGVWALIAQQLSNVFIDTLILWITVKWRPRLQFSWQRFRRLFSFGWRMLVSSLFLSIYDHLGQLIISKRYTSADLAFYNQGDKIPSLVGYNVDTAISSVILPALAHEQDHPEVVKSLVKRAMQMSSYLMWPIMMGLYACANSLVAVLLTDKWLPAVPFLRISCLSFAILTFQTINLQAITAMGRADTLLRISIFKRCIGILLILLAVPHGVLAIALAEMSSEIISTVINAHPNRQLIQYPYLEQVRDVLPSMLLSCGMALIVYQVEKLGLSPLVTLCLQIPTGVAVYVLGSLVFRLESFRYLLQTILQFFKKEA